MASQSSHAVPVDRARARSFGGPGDSRFRRGLENDLKKNLSRLSTREGNLRKKNEYE